MTTPTAVAAPDQVAETIINQLADAGFQMPTPTIIVNKANPAL